jgi:hypothetical protein
MTAKTKPSRTLKTTIYAPPDLIDFLHDRGARPDRSGGTWSRTAVLTRSFDLFAAGLAASDPRKTAARLPAAYYELAVELLTQPWKLGASDIKMLPEYLRDLPHFTPTVEAAGVDPEAFLAAIRPLSFTERHHIVDQAHQRHAPHDEPDL